LGQGKVSLLNTEVSSFQGLICTDSTFGPLQTVLNGEVVILPIFPENLWIE